MKTLIGLRNWQFDPNANELVGQSQTVRLTPKASATLALLVAAPGQVMSRAALTDQVGLSDEGLSRIINELREALQDQARDSRYIQTIPRRGYRLRADALETSAPLHGPINTGASNRQWIGGLVAAGLVIGLLTLRSNSPVDSPNIDASPGAASASVPDSSVSLPGPITRLTSFNGAARRPVVDGQSVWFDRTDRNGANLRAGQRIRIDSLSVEDGQWPDNVLHVHPGPRYVALFEEKSGQCTLQIQSLKGLRTTRPATPCNERSDTVDWSPDGQRLVASVGNGNIEEIHADGNSSLKLTNPSSPQTDLDPQFHTNGQSVSFIRSDGVVGELMMTDRHGNVRSLTNDHQMVFGHTWIDDKHVMFSSDRTGVRRLWLLNTQTQRFQDYGQPGVMGLHYQHPNLVFEMPTYRADIWHWDGKNATAVVDSPHYDNHPRISPDAAQLAFVSTRSGATGLWVSDPDGRNPRLLVDISDGRITRPAWLNPHELMYVIYRQRGSEAHKIDLNTGIVTPILDRQHNPREVIADASGEIFFLADGALGNGVYHRRDGAVTLHLSGDFSRLELGPGGNLFVTPSDLAQVNQVTEKPGNIIRQDLLVRLAPGRSLDWTIGDDWLYYRAADGMRRQSLTDTTNELLAAPSPSSIGLTLSASPDGENLYIARFHSVQIDLMHTRITQKDILKKYP